MPFGRSSEILSRCPKKKPYIVIESVTQCVVHEVVSVCYLSARSWSGRLFLVWYSLFFSWIVKCDRLLHRRHSRTGLWSNECETIERSQQVTFLHCHSVLMFSNVYLKVFFPVLSEQEDKQIGSDDTIRPRPRLNISHFEEESVPVETREHKPARVTTSRQRSPVCVGFPLRR